MLLIETYIERHAESTPHKPALVCGADSITYSELWGAVTAKAKELAGFKGRVVPFRATASIETVVTYFAIHMAGAAASPLDKSLPDSPMAELSERLAFASIPDGVADVLFTTGTTGMPKGVLISHKALLANSENLVEAQGFSPSTCFVVCGPLNHIGSLSKIHPTLLMGGTVYILDGLRDLNAFFSLIDKIEGNHVASFLVPANIRMLLSFGRDRLASLADKIEFIETGAAPMAQADMEALCATLPRTRLFNTYASTETGIVCTFNYNSEECVAGCLGRPMRHSHVRITEDGCVACSGDTIMSGYIGYANGQCDAERRDEIVTNDLGEIDNLGRLWLRGRRDDVINIGGFKVAPHEVEAAAMDIDWVRDCVCVESNHRIMGRTLKLLVVTSGCEVDARAIAKHLRDRLEPHKIPTAYERVDSIARTFNGKVDRKAYRAS